jgi:hypothetical protein
MESKLLNSLAETPQIIHFTFWKYQIDKWNFYSTLILSEKNKMPNGVTPYKEAIEMTFSGEG